MVATTGAVPAHITAHEFTAARAPTAGASACRQRFASRCLWSCTSAFTHARCVTNMAAAGDFRVKFDERAARKAAVESQVCARSLAPARLCHRCTCGGSRAVAVTVAVWPVQRTLPFVGCRLCGAVVPNVVETAHTLVLYRGQGLPQP